jgi:H+/Cl- antiporter ClcA
VFKIAIKIIFFFLIAVWYILSPSEYSNYHILPIVQMGEHSWPLYFFLLDGLALITMGLYIFLLISNYRRARRSHLRSLLWLFAGLLLIYPLIGVMATYFDLTNKYCEELKNGTECVRYVPPPDLKNIRLIWEK